MTKTAPLRTRVKICGITRAADAEAAVAAGADAIGLVFYEQSPRHVTIEAAAGIAGRVAPFVSCVGLFVDADPDYIRQALDQVALDALQFHGQESGPSCSLYGKPYIKAVRMSETVDLAAEVRAHPGAKALLLDTWVKGAPGGTGRCFDWGRVPEQRAKPLILAGGLRPSNVRQAIARTRPYAVDVSGGVEAAPGQKDPDKMINFIREAMYGESTKQCGNPD